MTSLKQETNNIYESQNDSLLNNLLIFYDVYNADGTFNPNNNLDKMLSIISGESKISLRIIDWFTTNYAKKYYTCYLVAGRRFKVYDAYKLKLKGYSKHRFDPFCRWERISIPYVDNKSVETTIGQLNFFKWALENKVIEYIINNYADIEKDMNSRNSTSKRKELASGDNTKTRKKREELSVSATKSIKKEEIEIIVKFG